MTVGSDMNQAIPSVGSQAAEPRKEEAEPGSAPEHGSCCAAWHLHMGRCEESTSSVLGNLAGICALRPCPTIGLSLFLGCLCMAGFANLTVESNGDNLWLDQNTVFMEHRDYVRETYSAETRPQFISVTTNPGGGDVLTAEPIAELLRLHDEIMLLETEDGFTWSDVCQRDPFNRCAVGGVPAFFATAASARDMSVSRSNPLNTSIFFDDPTTANVKAIIAADKTTDGWSFPSGSEVAVDNVMLGWDESAVSAKGARAFYGLMGTSPLRCEGLVGDACSTDKQRGVQKELENLLTELVERLMLHSIDGDPQTPLEDASIIWYMQTARSVNDELARAVVGDVALFVFALVIMCCFCCIILGANIPCKGCLNSRVLLGCQGVGLIVLSIGGGYGLCSGFGVPFTTLQSVLPFILIGIGVDDMLVITTAFDGVSHIDPGDPVSERIRKAYCRCGPSITLTSATDIVAFALGAVSKLPAIRFFCLYAAVSIMMVYIFMCTTFAAMLALDARRQEARRLDCLPCIRSGEGTQQKDRAMPLVQRGMASFADVLLTPVGKAVALMVFFGVLAVNCWAWKHTTAGFDIIDLTPDNSYARDYLELNLEMTGSDLTAIPFGVYTETMDYHDAAVQDMYMKLHNDVLANPKVDPTTMRSWYLNFQQFLSHRSSPYRLQLDENGQLTDSSTFYSALAAFFDFRVPNLSSLNMDEIVQQPTLTATFYSTLGAMRDFALQDPDYGPKIFERWANDVIWVDSEDPTKGISAARFFAAHPVAATADTPSRIACLEEMEKVAAASDLVPTVAIWSSFYMLFDQFRMIYDEMVVNFAMCLLAIGAMCLLALHHLSVVALTCVLITLVDIDLIGSVYWWGLEVNSISIINLIMATGLVVDYSAHIVHTFVAIKHDATTTNASAQVASNSLKPSNNGLSDVNNPVSQQMVGTTGADDDSTTLEDNGARKMAFDSEIAQNRIMSGDDIARATLIEMGPPVLLGGLTTLLGIVPLSLAHSTIFRTFFKMFLGIIIYGQAHGLILMPVVLSLITI